MAGVNIAITSGNIGFTLTVQSEWIETETTQERVLQTLRGHEKEINHIRAEQAIIKLGTDDRWKKEQELDYQKNQERIDKRQDERIRSLERTHPYRHDGRYN